MEIFRVPVLIKNPVIKPPFKIKLKFSFLKEYPKKIGISK